MLCRDIMKGPVDIARFDATISEVATRMGDARIGFMPVCDESGRVLGVVTDRDIAIRAFSFESDAPGAMAIAHIMTPELVACRADDDVKRAEVLMREYKVSRVLVVDDRHQPVGVISSADLSQLDDADAARTLRVLGARDAVPPRP
jgi:CBS domain-containing protein